MKKYFDNRKKLILSLIYSVLLMFCGVTFGLWTWESLEENRSNIAFLVEDQEGGYSCMADGGGEIVNNEAIIMPAPCTSSENVIMREITTNVEIERKGIEVNYELWLDVNDIGVPLTESVNFKYVVTDSVTSCNTGILSEGNFNGKTSGSKVNIFNENYLSSDSKKIYLYIWLDEGETNVATANQNFNLSLGGNCSGISLNIEKPVLDEGMIPVVISDDGKVTTIDKNDENWYDYGNQRWANIILVNENVTSGVDGSQSREYYKNNTGVEVLESDILAYYTWIPRYKYKIWTTDATTTTNPQEIDIMFEGTDEEYSLGNSVGEYRTHPAFWWDVNSDGNITQNEMLPGIWVGKFETTGTEDKPTVLPNTTSLVNQNVSTQFQTSLKFAGGLMNTSTGDVSFNGNNVYGLTIDTDSHMMKNSEWGAVAYLSHSKYGINEEVRINNYYNNGTLTGCGALTENEAESTTCGITYGGATEYPQSTTGNITGVYDMSGGFEENVMGNFANTIDSSGFTIFPNNKYYDLYSSTQFTGDRTTNMILCTLEICGGHALYETSGWYTDHSRFVDASSPTAWFGRGGNYTRTIESGIFYSGSTVGKVSANLTFRSVLIPLDYINIIFDANGGSLYKDIAEPILYNTYTTSGQYTFNVPVSGEYKLETWGAQGGTSTVRGGYGSYTSGKIDLHKDEKIYVYIGENYNGYKNSYSYNGGGSGTYSTVTESNKGYNGGGASDIRYFGNYIPSETDLLWDSEIGLNSRIMTAAGGGGSNNNYEIIGGNGGGLVGYSGNFVNKGTDSIVVPTGGTQVSGGLGTHSNTNLPFMGIFGAGGYYSPYSSSYVYAGGGGGGYYGGGAGGAGSSIIASAAGGSSYISGHTGCVSITGINDRTPKLDCTTGTSINSCSVHYSNKTFKDTVMIDGSGYSWTNSKQNLTQMPKPTSGNYSSGSGHTGSGAAKITLIRELDDLGDFLVGSLYGELPVPIRYGYIFLGWYTDVENGTLITEDTLVSSDIDKLYAHWNLAPTYTISYNANGGSGVPDSQIKIYGQILTLSSTKPTRTGYTFLGWSTDSNATSATYLAGGSYTVNSAATLYAVWEEIKSPVGAYSCANGSAGSSFVFTYTGNCTVIDDGSGNWRVKFLTSGTFTSTANVSIDVFLVGGGAGGKSSSSAWSGTSGGDGGGGGYTLTAKNINLNSNGSYEIVIGSGGSSGGGSGGSSTAFGQIAAGGSGLNGGSSGGAGGSYGGTYSCGSGGSGSSDGGGSYGQKTVVGPNGETGSTREFGESDGDLYAGGGGGGGAKNGDSNNYCSGSSGSGGSGGGGTAANNNLVNGVANTGGGGGGGKSGYSTGSGGSGIVIIRNKR